MNQKQIYELIEKFDESRLSELEIESEGFRITLRDESASVPSSAAMPLVAQAAAYHPEPGVQTAPAAPAAASAPEATGTAASETADKVENTEIITSPIVGTFYRSPAPDAPAFVEVGGTVAAGDSICIIEAMKIMNKLEAEFPCEIVKILAESGQMVEYGAPLFEVKRS
jgi:acetyl-CoA carboxylase biotin carboxyl carrier protein